MPMTRAQLRRQAVVAKSKAARSKPIERRRVRQFMKPITSAMNQIMQGSVDCDDTGIPITRLDHIDEYAALDECIEGFASCIESLMPGFDVSPLRHIASDLRKGKLISRKKAVRAFEVTRQIEDQMINYTWEQVHDAANKTMIEIELERLGLKAA